MCLQLTSGLAEEKRGTTLTHVPAHICIPLDAGEQEDASDLAKTRLLYHKLLGLSVPYDFAFPPFRDGVRVADCRQVCVRVCVCARPVCVLVCCVYVCVY